MRRHAKRIMAVSMAFALLASGCTNKAPESSAEGKAAKAAEPKQKVKIRMVSWSSASSFKMQKSVVDMYSQKNPDIEVIFESVPEQYTEKLLTQIAAGDAPDIIMAGNDQLSPFAEKGGLTDLDEFVKGPNGINTADYFENILSFGKYKGKLYSMPKDWTNMAILYNKKMFDDANIPYPKAGWTWDEFYSIAKKLTIKDGNKTTQWGAKFNGADVSKIQPLMLGYSDGVVQTDGKKYEGYMNSDGMVKAMQFYRDAHFTDGISPGSSDTQALKGVDLFAAGKVAMSMDGRWQIETYKKDPNLKFGSVTLPVGPKGPANVVFYGGWGIYSKSKNKEAAWEVLKFISGPEGARVFADYGFSAHKLVAEEKGQMTDPNYKAFIDDMPNNKPTPQYSDPLYTKTGLPPMQQVIEKILLPGDVDVKKELNEAAKTADANLKRENK